MKIRKTITESRTYDRYQKTVCDVCGKETINHDDWSDDTDAVEETTVLYRTGNYGTQIVEYELDFCNDCFKSKIMSLVEKIKGGKVRPTNVECDDIGEGQ